MGSIEIEKGIASTASGRVFRSGGYFFSESSKKMFSIEKNGLNKG